MTKKQFVKMIEKGDVDDTKKFWENIYDVVYNFGWKNAMKEIKNQRKFIKNRK